MCSEWKNYQEAAAQLFRELGFDAQTDVTIQGARTKHSIDVLVTSSLAGFPVKWIVECKHWKSSVTKLHVLGLRQIVIEVGADRGVLLCESGFQLGAVEAAALTNVHLFSLDECRANANAEISLVKLRQLHDRVEKCAALYWDIPKSERIAHGLRPEAPDSGYSGDLVIKFVQDVLRKGLRGTYPVVSDAVWHGITAGYPYPAKFNSADAIVAEVGPVIQELEVKLKSCCQKSCPPHELE